MIIPKNLEELASYVESDQKGGFSFSLLIGVQTASSSIPLCLKLKPSIQI